MTDSSYVAAWSLLVAVLVALWLAVQASALADAAVREPLLRPQARRFARVALWYPLLPVVGFVTLSLLLERLVVPWMVAG